MNFLSGLFLLRPRAWKALHRVYVKPAVGKVLCRMSSHDGVAMYDQQHEPPYVQTFSHWECERCGKQLGRYP